MSFGSARHGTDCANSASTSSVDSLDLKEVYFRDLQLMAQQVPDPEDRAQLSEDLLMEFAGALVDGTVMQIVKGLQDIQKMNEKDLFHTRCMKVRDHKAQVQELERKHQEALQAALASRSGQIPSLRLRHEEELAAVERRNQEEMKRTDMKIILQFDDLISQQQMTMEKAGVPGYHVTANKHEVRLQMHLMEFMLKLYQKYGKR